MIDVPISDIPYIVRGRACWDNNYDNCGDYGSNNISIPAPTPTPTASPTPTPNPENMRLFLERRVSSTSCGDGSLDPIWSDTLDALVIHPELQPHPLAGTISSTLELPDDSRLRANFAWRPKKIDGKITSITPASIVVTTGAISPTLIREFEQIVINDAKKRQESETITIEERTTNFECSWKIAVGEELYRITCDDTPTESYTHPGFSINKALDINNENNQIDIDRLEEVGSVTDITWSISARTSNNIKYSLDIAELEIPVITTDYVNSIGGVLGTFSNDDRCQQAPTPG